MQNEAIRASISASGLKYWEVADAIGIADTTFARWLRHELPEEKQKQILAAIDRLEKERK